MSPDTETVAKRNYYIGVDEEILYRGRLFDNLLIPEGAPFSMEMTGGKLELRGLITPFTIRPADGLSITPWIDLGLFGFVGYYEIEAGEPRGTTRYLFPPEDFVIGGSSEGVAGLGLPEAGLGGEVRLGDDRGANLVVQGHYAVCQYDGSTKYLASSRHREKDADIDHSNVRVRVSVEIPLKNGRAVTLGGEYQSVESEAEITSTGQTLEEIIARRERFDKRVDFRMESLVGMLGLTF
jgi:hypothetical protein